MRRPVAGAVVLVAVALLGVAAIVGAAAVERRDLAFTLGVPPARTVITLERGVGEVCQLPIEVLEPFDAVQLNADTSDPGRSTLTVSVRGPAAQVLASDRVPVDSKSDRLLRARVGPVPAGGPVSVCVEASGPARVELFGDLGGTVPETTLMAVGEERDGDLSLAFLRGRPTPVTGLVPAMLERASLFRPPGLGPLAYVILGLLAVVGVPGLLALSLARAARDDSAFEDPPGSSAREPE